MKKHIVSDLKQKEIIKMREAGAGWLAIENETHIPRRTSKRVFEDYQRSLSDEVIRAARRQVAITHFNQHMGDLFTIAKIIPTLFADPSLQDRRDEKQVLNDFMAVGILERDKPGESGKIDPPNEVKARHNKMVLDSLKQHTKEKVNWSAFDKGLKSWNDWKDGITALESKVKTLIGNYLENERRDINSAKKIKKNNKKLSTMCNGVVETVYHAILSDRLDDIENNINVKEMDRFAVQFWGADTSTRLFEDDKNTVDVILRVCREVLIAITKGGEEEQAAIKALVVALGKIRASRKQLERELDELLIVPQVLRTKCDICPA